MINKQQTLEAVVLFSQLLKNELLK